MTSSRDPGAIELPCPAPPERVRRLVLRRGLEALLLLGLVIACCPDRAGRDDGSAGPASESGAGVGSARLSTIQRDLFDRHCVTDCHETTNAAASLSLSQGRSHASLVNQPSQQLTARLRVTPGDPGSSYLVKKLEGGAGMAGDRMPRLAPPRPAAEIEQVRAWITRGAPDD